jgi:RNA binding exosome subunit
MSIFSDMGNPDFINGNHKSVVVSEQAYLTEIEQLQKKVERLEENKRIATIHLTNTILIFEKQVERMKEEKSALETIIQQFENARNASYMEES